jgi:hypothetical protein
MKVTRFLLSALFLGAMATTAFAQGAVSLNWDTCTGPINKAVAPGSAGNAMNASVLGHSMPHQAYQVYVALGSGNAGNLRDAWRFDAAGCQGSSLITINHLAPGTLSKACPSFQGALASIQIKDYSYDGVAGKARAVLANTYPAGNNTQINPAQRYFLAQFVFDHSFSVNGPSDPGQTCGGVEVPVCAHLTRTSWLSLSGVETPWAYGQEYVTANDPNNATGCPGATPAENKTWGQVKAQYKR